MDEKWDGSVERRRHPRKPVKLNRMFTAEVHIGDQTKRCYLHVHDISQSGMRLSTQLHLPAGIPLRVRFFFHEHLELPVQVMWQREGENGQMLGIQFMDVTPETEEAIARLMDRLTGQGREQRRTMRLDHSMRVEVEVNGVRTPLTCTTLEVSRGGMRISADVPLLEGETYRAHIELEPGKPLVELPFQVVWKKPTSFEKTLMGLTFVDPSEEALASIDRFLQRVQSGTLTSVVKPAHPAP